MKMKLGSKNYPKMEYTWHLMSLYNIDEWCFHNILKFKWLKGLGNAGRKNEKSFADFHS